VNGTLPIVGVKLLKLPVTLSKAAFIAGSIWCAYELYAD
jgi:hypothetical protein